MPAFIDLTGQRFGKLTAIRLAPKRGKENRWELSCECGGSAIYTTANIRHHKPTSCGCDSREKRAAAHRKHGKTKSPLHQKWSSMRNRCNNPNSPAYSHYGGRGIKVCSRWDDFANFAADVGHPPSPAYSLDRIDNDGDYEPGNVRWATRIEQANNTTRNAMVTYAGTTMCVADWARKVGLSRAALYTRLRRGMSPEEALTTSPRYAASRVMFTGITRALAADKETGK